MRGSRDSLALLRASSERGEGMITIFFKHAVTRLKYAARLTIKNVERDAERDVVKVLFKTKWKVDKLSDDANGKEKGSKSKGNHQHDVTTVMKVVRSM